MHFDPRHIVSKPKMGQNSGKTIRINLVSNSLTVGHPIVCHAIAREYRLKCCPFTVLNSMVF